MTCELAHEKMAAADMAAVQDHLRTCAACAEAAREFESDRLRLASVPPEVATVDFAAMRRDIRRAIVRKRRRRTLWPVLAAAAAIAMAAGIEWQWHDAKRPVPAPPVMVHASIPAAPLSVPAPTRRTAVHPARVSLRAAAAPTPEPDPDVMRVPTKDPSVIILWLPESKGDSNE
jgi:anti-sigma factor RsiW